MHMHMCTMLTHTFLQAKAWNEKVKANFWSEDPIEPILRLRAVVPATLVAMYGRVKEQANMQSSNTDPVAQNALRFNLRATGPAVQPARVVGGKGRSTGVSPPPPAAPLSLPTSAGSVGTGVGTAGAGGVGVQTAGAGGVGAGRAGVGGAANGVRDDGTVARAATARARDPTRDVGGSSQPSKKRKMKRSNQLCQTCGHSKKSGETAKLHTTLPDACLLAHVRFADPLHASLKAEYKRSDSRHNTAYASVVCDCCVNGDGNHAGKQRWSDLNRLLGMLNWNGNQRQSGQFVPPDAFFN